jgi:hypothetical protein
MEANAFAGYPTITLANSVVTDDKPEKEEGALHCRPEMSPLSQGSRYALLFVALLAISVCYKVTVEAQQTPFDWTDEFNYKSVTDFVNAGGWIVLGNASLIRLLGNGIQLDDNGPNGVSIYHGGFPVSIYDWHARSEGEWLGRSYGSIGIEVDTTSHSYQWAGDGAYPEFVLYRDGVKVLQFRGYSPQSNTSMEFAIDKRGNTLSLYYNGIIKATYNESGFSGELVGITLHSGWISTTLYSHVEVSGSASTPGQSAVNVSQQTPTNYWASDFLPQAAAVATIIGTVVAIIALSHSRRKDSAGTTVQQVGKKNTIIFIDGDISAISQEAKGSLHDTIFVPNLPMPKKPVAINSHSFSIQEIANNILNERMSLTPLVGHTLQIAKQLGKSEEETWLERELYGYDKIPRDQPNTFPEYRRIPTTVHIQMTGIMQTGPFLETLRSREHYLFPSRSTEWRLKSRMREQREPNNWSFGCLPPIT